MSHVSIITESPAVLSTAEAKAHLRLPGADTSQDDYIASLCSAATRYIETTTDRVLVSGSLQLTRPTLSTCIEIPRAPIISVDSIVLTDEDGAETTVASSVYGLDTTTVPPRVRLRTNQSYPTVSLGNIDPVAINFTAGYGSTDAVPADLKHAAKLLVGAWFEVREPVVLGTIATRVPLTVEALLASYKVYPKGDA